MDIYISGIEGVLPDNVLPLKNKKLINSFNYDIKLIDVQMFNQ